MITLLKKIFSRNRITRALFFMVCDVIFIAASFWLAYMLKFDFAVPAENYRDIAILSVLGILFTIPIFYFLGLYRFSWSFVSTQDLVALFKGLTLSFIFIAVTVYISRDFHSFEGLPRSVFLISYGLIFLFSGGLRLSKRIYLNALGKQDAQKEKTLIVGAGDLGEQLVRNMQALHDNPYYLVGFVDDNPIKRGVKIHGLKVLGKVSDIVELAKTHEIKQLIVAVPSNDQKAVRHAIDMGKKAGIKKIKIAPPLSEIIRGKTTLKSINEVDAENLLGRNQIQLDKKQIEQCINGKVIVITGAAGSIGSELAKQVARFKPSQLVIVDQDETGIFNILGKLREQFAGTRVQPYVADIQDASSMERIFAKEKPNVVFHAAAYKHVGLMEDQPAQAIQNNIFGTDILAQTSLQHQVEKFIFISTDKAVNPTSIMGATKRAGEMLCQAYNQSNGTKFISVRFGNVLDSRGSVIPIFREQIKRGGPVEVTDPGMQRYFMLTREACLLVMQAGAMGHGGEVFVLDMGKPVAIVDLAKEMIRLSGLTLDKDITIVFTGVRPGEKLFEEILTAEEGTVATQNQQIFVAKLAAVDIVAFQEQKKKLADALKTESSEALKKLLAELVPSYRVS